MEVAIVIPARYSSKRLPGKPLLRETGKYLVQHVYERACLSRRALQVVVATDDPRIASAVSGFGGQVVMTSKLHPSGTDRVAEAAQQLGADIIVNLQGDEPLIDPGALDLLFELLERDPRASMATLAVPIKSIEEWEDPNCVKVVADKSGRALYFSRSPIPYFHGSRPSFSEPSSFCLRHLGVYGYRKEFLRLFNRLPPHPLEQLEKLEQLRVVAHGYAIRLAIVNHEGQGVDTYEDYRKFVETYRSLNDRRSAA